MGSMSFKEFHAESVHDINRVLDKYLADWLELSDRQSGSRLTSTLETLVSGATGGKVLRGSLVRLGYELTGAHHAEDILKPAAAYEILHTSLLIHDDVMDKSLVRRGKPTAYKALGEDHYGVSQAICLGDAGFFLATKMIAESEFDASKKTEVIATFSQIVMDTVLGQMLDVKLSRADEVKNEPGIELIQKYKTAIYTVAGPLAVGAKLGGANDGTLRALQKYGEFVGMAFQIQDDILGVFGDAPTVGKSVTSDIEENKNTLLISYALENAAELQKEFLNDHYGQGKLKPEEHEEMKSIFEKCGALRYSEDKAGEYASKGKEYIPQVTSDSQMQSLLGEFADYIVNRQK
jgi:geranylgeranyl diphosphate synthase, type I